MPITVACVVPARYASTRYPGKLLEALDGKPVILHTLGQARKASCFDEIVCLTDSEDIAKIVSRNHYDVYMTSPAANGTERIAHNLELIKSSHIINLQGDEPIFPVASLIDFYQNFKKYLDDVCVLLYNPEDKQKAMNNPNRMKTLVNRQSQVVGFRRRFEKDFVMPSDFKLGIQMGIYGYSKSFLAKYGKLPSSEREREESHELLRDLTLNTVRAFFTDTSSLSVDVPEDLVRIRRRLGSLSGT
ncbi:MAG: hypothetical protein HQK83_16595 [Fibrobacteria bacterium]|nr:hypothetical protein [Fibrobacteria bacterium]